MFSFEHFLGETMWQMRDAGKERSVDEDQYRSFTQRKRY
jgi:hypothetical protein